MHAGSEQRPSCYSCTGSSHGAAAMQILNVSFGGKLHCTMTPCPMCHSFSRMHGGPECVKSALLYAILFKMLVSSCWWAGSRPNGRVVGGCRMERVCAQRKSHWRRNRGGVSIFFGGWNPSDISNEHSGRYSEVHIKLWNCTVAVLLGFLACHSFHSCDNGFHIKYITLPFCV